MNSRKTLKVSEKPQRGATHPQLQAKSKAPPPPRRLPSKRWRELVLKVWHADPLRCPACGRPMRVIAVIDQPRKKQTFPSFACSDSRSTHKLDLSAPKTRKFAKREKPMLLAPARRQKSNFL
jgi:hypothetical protein